MNPDQIKADFEANFLDGDKIQEGQTLSSDFCLEAIYHSLAQLLTDEIGVLEKEKKCCGGDLMMNDELEQCRGFNFALDQQIDRYKSIIKSLE